MKDKICFPQTVEFKSCNATIYVQTIEAKNVMRSGIMISMAHFNDSHFRRTRPLNRWRTALSNCSQKIETDSSRCEVVKRTNTAPQWNC